MRVKAHSVLGVMVLVSAIGCASVPKQQTANDRRAAYLASSPKMSAEVAWAVETAHISIGMDRKQVEVVLGQPLSKRPFAKSDTEVWVYSGGRLHQGQLHSHGNEAFRLVFRTGRLLLIETL